MHVWTYNGLLMLSTTRRHPQEYFPRAASVSYNFRVSIFNFSVSPDSQNLCRQMISTSEIHQNSLKIAKNIDFSGCKNVPHACMDF